MLLADGRLHSGERLAQLLGVSRAAVWKAIERLRIRGIPIEAVARRGYRLPDAVEMLNEAPIRAAVAAAHVERLHGIEILFDVDSTNNRLFATAPPPYGKANVVLTELQHAGRGRRGKTWIAQFGGSIALSLRWSFADASQVSAALSLCVGVAVAHALTRAGARGIVLKWPNDIWCGDRKLGGILLEMRVEASGPGDVVIGIGINVTLTADARARIERTGVRVAAVADACVAAPSRNFVAGAILDELLSMLVRFEREGFAGFRSAWSALDALRDRPARVLMADGYVSGTVRGVDANGALLLDNADGAHAFVSGEVSLRLDGDDI